MRYDSNDMVSDDRRGAMMIRYLRKLWQQNQWLLILSGWVIGVLSFPTLDAVSADISGFISDLVPEAVGILFTVLIIDRLDAQRELEQLQNRLVREATGQSNEMAKSALDWMQHEGWLAGEESLLAGQEATRANMDGVNLVEANLERTDFYKSTLRNVNAFATKAHNTNFGFTDLTNADFVIADLTGANLDSAILDGVIFYHPNQGAAILPDGTPWTEDTDMRRFTDHTHPNFWRSDDPESFAYIGMEDYWSKRREPKS